MHREKPPDPLGRRLAALKAARPVDAPPAPPGKARKERAERRSAYRIVRIAIDDGSTLRAVMRDFSATGARIVLEGAHALPPRIIVHIDQTGEKRKANVVWQEEAEAGLEFAPQEH